MYEGKVTMVRVVVIGEGVTQVSFTKASLYWSKSKSVHVPPARAKRLSGFSRFITRFGGDDFPATARKLVWW